MSSVGERWESAGVAYRAGDLAKAERLAREVFDADPSHAWSQHLLSMIAHRRGETELEIQFLEKALEVDPDHIESLVGLAHLSRLRGNLDRSLQLSRRVIGLAPTNANGHAALGLGLCELREFEEAAASFERAVALQPNISSFHTNLGNALRHTSRVHEAAASYRKAIQLSPNSVRPHEALGQLGLYEDHHEEAIAHFKRAVAIEPKSDSLKLQLAEALARNGKTEPSLELIRDVLAKNPTSSQALCQLGLRMQEVGDFTSAVESFQRSLDRQPLQGHAFLGLFTSIKVSDGDRELVERGKALLKDSNLTPVALMQLETGLSKAYDDLGEYEVAVAHMDQANRIMREQFAVSRPFDRRGISSYVDDAVRLFTPEFFRAARLAVSETDLPLLIVGLPRSGTTLVEQILSGQPEVAAGGELRFWGEAHASLRRGLLGAAMNPSEAARLGQVYLSRLKEISPLARFVTDKMPNNFFHMGLIHVLFPNARFIHCRRYPMDNGVSLYMTPFHHRPAFVQTREDIVFYFQQYHRLMAHWKAVLPQDRVLDVDYEAVVTDQQEATERILEFCDIQPGGDALRPEENRRVVTTPSKWQTRQPIYRTSVERWRRYEPWLGALKELKSYEIAN